MTYVCPCGKEHPDYNAILTHMALDCPVVTEVMAEYGIQDDSNVCDQEKRRGPV
jgi:hypothetical protein